MFFKKFDFLSSEITLFYHGKDNHSSIFSGILSIVMAIFVIFLIGYLSIDVLAKQHPTSFYFTKFIEEIDEYPLNSSSILHYVSLYNSDNHEIGIDTKAINVVGVSINDGVFTEDNDISKYSHWIYEYCEFNDLGQFNSTYTQAQIDNLTNSLCISKYYDKDTQTVISKNDDGFFWPTLAHGASQHNNFEYGLYFQRCQNNSIINGNNCYSKSQQDAYIRTAIGYEIYFIDHSIDVEQYNEPIIYSVHRITSELNSASFVLNHLNFHPVVVRTNDALFFDNLKTQISYNFDYNEKITHTNNDYNILGSFNFWMQNTIDTYDRAYKKIQDIAGGIDGILAIVMLIVRFINYFFFNGYQEIIDFHQELQIDSKNKGSSVKLNNSYISISKSNNSGKRDNIDQKVLSITNNISSKRSIINRKNAFITNANNSFSNINNIPKKKIEFKIPKKTKWIHYITTITKVRKYNYIENLQDKREGIISEEKIIEMNFMLNRINEKIKKDNNNNNQNNTLITEYEKYDTNNIDNNINTNTNNNNNEILYRNQPMPLLLKRK
jgi:hypothetical protein